MRSISRIVIAGMILASSVLPATVLALPCPDAAGPISQALSKGIVGTGSGSAASPAGDVTAVGGGSLDAAARSVQGDFPDLAIKIPGLQFSNSLQSGTSERGTQTLLVPYLAQYVSAVYKYLVGISTIIASVMVIYGGLLYLLGETAGDVSKGKKYIEDALVGVILLFSTVMILRIVGVDQALKPLAIDLIKRDPALYMGVNNEAPATLAEVGITPRENPPAAGSVSNSPTKTGTPDKAEARPTGGTIVNGEYVPPKSTAQFPTDLTIPVDCPGRDPKFEATLRKAWPGSSTQFSPTNYVLCSKFGCISGASIAKYLEEQSRSGVPAGVLMAQIRTEAGPCPVVELFQNPEKCGGLNFNFGGIGCTAGQVPPTSCPHTAFPTGYVQRGANVPKGKLTGTCEQTDGLPAGIGPNSFNKAAKPNSDVCQRACEDYKTPEQLAKVDGYCGKCFPLVSTATVSRDGIELRYNSMQCSKKFDNVEQFLGSHLGFVKACLPYNDSVYKFAYCIGASTYAGSSGDKGTVLAEIIERNCLCGSKDSSKCKRDLELEAKLNKAIIKKTNFFKFPPKCLDCNEKGKCIKYAPQGTTDYDAIVKELMKNAGLKPNAEFYPETDPPIKPAN